MNFRKYLSIVAVLSLPFLAYKANDTLGDIKNSPFHIHWYEKIEVFDYPVFFLLEYQKESQRELKRLPATWEEHLQITDNMKFGKEYGLVREIKLAEAQRILGKKVGDGEKVRWLFP